MNIPEGAWFLDCYSWGQVSGVGREFPVDTYWSESLEVVITEANFILSNPNGNNGIDEVRISKETKGQSPMYIGFRRQP